MNQYNPPKEPQWKDFPLLSHLEFIAIHDIWREELEEYRIKWKQLHKENNKASE